MMKALFAIVLLGHAFAATQAANAASMRVSPTVIEIPAPGAASTLRLHNPGAKGVSVQVRVYRWTQSGGGDHLTETDSVVASPPIAALPSGKSQIVRIVRVSKDPVQGEESYRILVDEIPDGKGARSNAVTLAVRHSIPVFFSPGTPRSDSLEWSIEQIGNSLICVVHNRGEQRVRLAALQLKDLGGHLIAQQDGLVGYVLGQSSVSLPISGYGKRRLGDSIEISALTENGPIRATGTVVARD
ncbi:molecular chaperone [Hyphomicrobium sp. CS1GBMeth3]|uniref:fimbrial biogenesis chaperone n=1 Tax=Hyphomicrobium sp. CS1GBMeth3 TaxID=1892845 RepID=UPI0009F9C2CD|nr:molecular chaperone [Hyphomicrobium sp. CS1GBMeth3]